MMRMKKAAIFLGLALILTNICPGDMGKQKNREAPADQIRRKLREKRPTPKMFISAEIVDENEVSTQMKYIVVDSNEFSIMGKHSSGWTDLELEKLKSIEITKKNVSSDKQRPENFYSEEDSGDLLMQIFVTKEGEIEREPYLVNSKIFLSGRTEKGRMKRGWFLKDLKEINILDISFSKDDTIQGKLRRKIMQEEAKEKRADDDSGEGFSILEFLGFKKKSTEHEPTEEEKQAKVKKTKVYKKQKISHLTPTSKEEVSETSNTSHRKLLSLGSEEEQATSTNQGPRTNSYAAKESTSCCD